MAGKKANVHNTACFDCPPGRYSDIAQTECKACDFGVFAEGYGNDSCESCEKILPGSTTKYKSTKSRNGCLCEPGYYKSPKYFPPKAQPAKPWENVCKPLSELNSLSGGINLEEGDTLYGLTLQTIPLKSGFWRITENSTILYPCFHKEYCSNSTVDGNVCAEGRTGPYCEVCDNTTNPKYVKSRGECVKCEGNMRNTVILGTMGIVFGVLFMIYMCVRLDDYSPESMKGYFRLVMKWSKSLIMMAKNGKVQGKILASYFQIVSSLPFNFNLSFPVEFALLMKYFNFINIDIGMMPVGCVTELNHFTNLYTLSGGSLAIIVILAVLSHMAKEWKSRKVIRELTAKIHPGKVHEANDTKDGAVEEGGGDDGGNADGEGESGSHKKKVGLDYHLFNNLLIFSFLMLPTVSTTILNTFGCEELIDPDYDENGDPIEGKADKEGEGIFLKIDRSKLCYSDDHKAAMIFAYVMAFIFIGGIPMWYMHLLWRQRFDLNPGQDELVGHRTMKYYDTETKSWVFLNMMKKENGKERKPGDKLVIFEEKDIWDEHKKRVEEEGEDAKKWIIVESMSDEEALFCAIYHRTLLEEKNPDLKRLSFLYSDYEPRCWAFEVFETFRRIMLTGGQVWLRPGTAAQIIFSIIICLGSMRVYAAYDPFVSSKHDKLAEAAQWQLLFTLLGSLAIRVNLDNESLQDQRWFKLLLVVTQFFVIILVLYQMLQKKRYNDNTKEEEDVPIKDTLKEMPCLKSLIEHIENATSCASEMAEEVVHDDFGGQLEAMINSANKINEDVKDAVSGIIGVMKGKIIEFLHDTISEGESVFEGARDARRTELENQGVTDEFKIIQESNKAGLLKLKEEVEKQLTELQIKAEKKWDDAKKLKRGDVENALMMMGEEELQKAKEEMTEVWKEWIKEKVKAFVMKELDKMVSLPSEGSKVVKNGIPKDIMSYGTAFVEQVVLRLVDMFDMLVQVAVEKAIDKIFDFMSRGDMKLKDLGGGLIEGVRKAADDLMFEEFEKVKGELEKMKENVKEDLLLDETGDMVQEFRCDIKGGVGRDEGQN